MSEKRRSVSLKESTVERLDDLIDLLGDDEETVEYKLSRAELVTALIFAVGPEPASLGRLLRLGRMEQLDEPSPRAYAACERTAIALGWRPHPEDV